MSLNSRGLVKEEENGNTHELSTNGGTQNSRTKNTERSVVNEKASMDHLINECAASNKTLHKELNDNIEELSEPKPELDWLTEQLNKLKQAAGIDVDETANVAGPSTTCTKQINDYTGKSVEKTTEGDVNVQKFDLRWLTGQLQNSKDSDGISWNKVDIEGLLEYRSSDDDYEEEYEEEYEADPSGIIKPRIYGNPNGEYARKYANETPEKRIVRLMGRRLYSRQRRAGLTNEERMTQRAEKNERDRLRRMVEDPEKKKIRLQRLKEYRDRKKAQDVVLAAKGLQTFSQKKSVSYHQKMASMSAEQRAEYRASLVISGMINSTLGVVPKQNMNEVNVKPEK